MRAGRRALWVGIAVAATAAALASGGGAALDAPLVTANWAGYAVTGTSTTYTSATGTWKEPQVTCTAADAGEASSFWVGLGGDSESSQALEQLGTSADCDAQTGKPNYYAWYELLPNPPVILQTKIHPGNTVTTSVNILAGGLVEFQIKNRTTGVTFTKKIAFKNPDLTSAEWIAEAPSECNQFRCIEAPLSNFGSVGFKNVAAIGNSAGGTLTANPGWTATQLTLDPGQAHRHFFVGRGAFDPSQTSTAGATASELSTDGRSFSVQWSADVAAGTA